MSETVTIVRVYLTESDAQLKPLLEHLHDVEKVKGVTAFRGIAGFGATGEMHSSSLLDMSLNLPIVVEFFDTTDNAMRIVEHLSAQIDSGRIVYWPAQANT